MGGLTLNDKVSIILLEMGTLLPDIDIITIEKGRATISFHRNDVDKYHIWLDGGGRYNTSGGCGWFCTGGTTKAQLYGQGYTSLSSECLSSLGIDDICNLQDHEYGILKLKYGLTKVDLYLPSFIEHAY